MRYILTVLLFAGLMAVAAPVKAQQDDRSEADLIAALNVPDNSDASVQQFMLAVKPLAQRGTEACIPALAAKLDNPRFAHYARFALEPNPSPKVDEALFKALKTLDGDLLIGVINSIGVRKTPGALEALLSIRGEVGDVDVALALISAAGELGTPEAAEELLNLLTKEFKYFEAPPKIRVAVSAAIADAAFACARHLENAGNAEKAVVLYDAVLGVEMPGFVHEAATYKGILARKEAGLDVVVKNLASDNWGIFAATMKAVRELPGDNVGKTLLGELGNLDSARKAMVLEAIADRGDKVVLPELIAGVKSSDEVVRLASIRGLKTVGDASSVEVLLNAALEEGGESAVAKAAQDTLVWCNSNDAIDKAIIDTLKNGKDSEKIIAADIIEQRRILSAAPVLIGMINDKNADVRKAATFALAETIKQEDFGVLLKALVDAKTQAETEELQRVLKSACGRYAQESCIDMIIAEYGKAPEKIKLFLLELLTIPSGPKAVDFVAAQFWGNNDVTIKDATSQILGEWPDTAAAEQLLKIAKESRENKYKVRGIRGYLRLARQFRQLDEGTRIEMCKTAFDAAARDEDKELIFDIPPRYPSEAMLTFVASYFDTKFQEKAHKAAVAVADKIQGKPPVVEETLKKILADTKDDELKARVQRILNR